MSLSIARVTLNLARIRTAFQSNSNGSLEEVYNENWTSILRQWNERERHDSQRTFPS